jgi:hypothetical protein
MAYDPNQLFCTQPGMSNTDDQEWLLRSVDAIADINTSNYISDGVRRGMHQGEIVKIKIYDTLPVNGGRPTGTVSAVYLAWVKDVGTGTNALGVDITDGLSLGTVDTD